MNAYTPPPSPPARLGPSQRDRDRDRTRNRRAASPRLKIRRRSFNERPPTPPSVQCDRHTPSPELIFSMSPTESHFTPPPKTTLNPGALLARARQQSSNAFANLNNRGAHPHRARPVPLLYSFPKTSTLHLRAPPTTGTTRLDIRPTRISPIAEMSDEGVVQMSDPHARCQSTPMPISIPLPVPKSDPRVHNSFDSTQDSFDSFYGSLDDEGDENEPDHHTRKAASASRPLKIVGFDTGTDSDSGDSQDHAGPFRFERFVSHKALSLDSKGDVQDTVRPLQARNRR